MDHFVPLPINTTAVRIAIKTHNHTMIKSVNSCVSVSSGLLKRTTITTPAASANSDQPVMAYALRITASPCQRHAERHYSRPRRQEEAPALVCTCRRQRKKVRHHVQTHHCHDSLFALCLSYVLLRHKPAHQTKRAVKFVGWLQCLKLCAGVQSGVDVYKATA